MTDVPAYYAVTWLTGFVAFVILAVAFAPRPHPRVTRAEILRRLYPDIEADVRDLEDALGSRHRRQFDIVLCQMRDDGLIQYRLVKGGRQVLWLTRAGRAAAVESQAP